MCEVIYIVSTQQKLKKKMDSPFSDFLRLPKISQKSDSFSDHFKEHIGSIFSRKDSRKDMTFKKLKQLNPIGAIKTSIKPKYNLCKEERLII